MDSLTERNKKARELGLSYGQYMALYHPPEPVERTEPIFERESGKKCIVCGKPLKGNQRLYCSADCKAGKKETVDVRCIVCGKRVEKLNKVKYCSDECRRKRATQLQRERRRRKMEILWENLEG